MTRVEAEAHEHASFLDSQIFGILKNGLGSKKKINQHRPFFGAARAVKKSWSSNFSE